MTEPTSRFRWHESGDSPAADLLRECGKRLTDPVLWQKFQERFQGLIFLYLMRALRIRGKYDDAAGIVPDLAQEVYLRLVQSDGQILRSFRGNSEFSVMAFLARISSNVAHDHHRRNVAVKRGQVVSIEDARIDAKTSRDSAEFDPAELSSILSWIDVERVVEGDPDRKNAQRNALIFKLHYVDGFSSKEIARFPGFELTPSGVEAILARLKKRIQEK
ncbi:MAG: RNA polymerase sigma factor [Acidobacteria bacterium]|nr:RNA polymerase sigma factor [Acidobacteriota bacterium]